MNWFLKLIAPKNQYKERYGLYDVIWHYIWAEREHNAMRGYIREHQGCDDIRRMPKGRWFKRRYNLDVTYVNGLAWYLLEQYFEGNITIKEDAQPKP